MTKKREQVKGIISTLSNTVETLRCNQQIVVPYVAMVFVQLLLLELMFFASRFPLKIFFEPLISKRWGEVFMHYPWNLMLVPQIFQSVQVPLFIFINSFIIAISIAILHDINEGKLQTDTTRSATKRALSAYVHLVIAATITFLFVWGSYKMVSPIYERASIIGATKGIKFFIKAFILYGMPYFNLCLGAIATALTAYIIPAIMIDRKRIFSATVLNFRILFRSLLFSVGIVLVPYLFFMPILLLRQLLSANVLPPGMTVWVTALSVLVTVAIDCVVYTSLATAYLLNKEEQ